MACCCSRVKSIIRELFTNNRNEQNIDLGTAQRSPISTAEGREARNDGHEENFLSRSFADFPAPIPASERLHNIGSWPTWKRQLNSRRTGSSGQSRSWVLERVPDPTPFESIQKLEDLLAALESSYENCIFEGLCRSEHSESVLYSTTLNQIAKFGCCSLCKSIAGTVRSGFPSLEPYSRYKKVVMWCADWGSLKADEANEAVVAKAFQEGNVFLTIGEEVPKLLEVFGPANKESQEAIRLHSTNSGGLPFASFYQTTTGRLPKKCLVHAKGPMNLAGSVVRESHRTYPGD